MDVMQSVSNRIDRARQRDYWCELATVVQYDTRGKNKHGVQCRDKPISDSSDDSRWNTVTVKVRQVKNELIPGIDEDLKDPHRVLHYYATVMQRDTNQKWAGHPYTPRIGDMVVVLFMSNIRPIIIGTVYTNHQDPVCRSPFCSSKECWATIDARYDDVDKWCQWEKPDFDDKTLEVKEQYAGQHPICDKKFHKFRDQIHVTDCKEGNKDPCDQCKTMDYIKRCGNQWEKIYSDITDAIDCEHPYLPHCNEKTKKRHEFHEPCGSYMVFQNKPNCGNCTTCEGTGSTDCPTCGGTGNVPIPNSLYWSWCPTCGGTGKAGCSSCSGTGGGCGAGCGNGGCDLDYGAGLVRLENATCESSMKGHINMGPRGTIDIHSVHENATYKDENQGTRTSVVSPEDTTVDWAWESINFATDSYIKCWKNGDVTINSGVGDTVCDACGGSGRDPNYIFGGVQCKVCGGSGMTAGNLTNIGLWGSQSKIVEWGRKEVHVWATDDIEWHTKLCHDFGDMQIDGFCTHLKGCSCGSDRRIKKDIQILDMGLDEILKLDPVSFLWKNQTDDYRNIGLVAQDVKEIIPQVVHRTNIINEDTPDGQLSISYEQLVPVLIKAIQEQNKKITELESKFEEFQKRHL